MRTFSSILMTSCYVFLSGCAGQIPADLGTVNGTELRPCPESPNCIQTYDPSDAEHFQSPLAFQQNDEQSKQAVTLAITETGGKVISEKALEPAGYYLHAEYESDWIKFVDDVEVVIKDGTIHIRSASRLGHSDFGVNAERYQAIKTAYEQ